MVRRTAPIPAPSETPFVGGIRHPDLWLWDSWTEKTEDGALHLYCLALSRRSLDGGNIQPSRRNDHSFHVRHFSSLDAGATWTDCGVAIEPGSAPDGADAHNVWSGSVLQNTDGNVLFGYTGIRDVADDRAFLQTICIGKCQSDGTVESGSVQTISCPMRDYEKITALGFYLGPRDRLGDSAGEEGGPIMAWRDPFLVRDKDGQLNAFWSAKVGPAVPAIARAVIYRDEGGKVSADLMPPILLPDAHEYSQSEVPKLYYDAETDNWLLLISACNRMYEGQPDSEVEMQQRLYLSSALDGSWRPCSKSGSVLGGLDCMFGASMLSHDLTNGSATIVGPFTERAGEDAQLSFPPVRQIELPELDLSTE